MSLMYYDRGEYRIVFRDNGEGYTAGDSHGSAMRRFSYRTQRANSQLWMRDLTPGRGGRLIFGGTVGENNATPGTNRLVLHGGDQNGSSEKGITRYLLR